MFQLTLGPFALGDVFVGCHPAAFFRRLVDDRDDAAVLQFDIKREGVALIDRGAQFGLVFHRVIRKCVGGLARIKQIADAAAGPNTPRIDVVHAPISFVPDHQPVLSIEHAQTLDHVIECNVELIIMLAEHLHAAPGAYPSGQTHTQ
jgi:hypothetical protein